MILRRYISQQIALTSFLVLGFVLFLLLGSRLIRYFGMAAEGQLDVGILFTIISYNIPFLLELVFPLAFFIALMLVFGRLYTDHEMAVINSSGISRGGLARLASPLVLLFFIIEVWLAVIGRPWGLRHSETIWQEQGMKSAFDLVRAGEFISSGDYHLYVGSIDKDKRHLQDIILIQTNSKLKNKATTGEKKTAIEKETVKQNPITTVTNSSTTPTELQNLPALPKQFGNKDSLILAKYAKQVMTNPSSGKTQLDLFNGRRYEIGANSQKYNQVSFQRYRITLTQEKKTNIDEKNVASQTIERLWHSAVKLNNPVAQAELGYRFALPWLILLAPLFAVPLAQVKPRQGRWLKLVPSVLLFVVLALSIISLKDVVKQERISVWAYCWLIIAFFVSGLYLNWAGRIHQRVRFVLTNKQTSTRRIKNASKL